MASRMATANDMLAGHVSLDLECFDRIYFNGWVPNLQVIDRQRSDHSRDGVVRHDLGLATGIDEGQAPCLPWQMCATPLTRQCPIKL